MLTYNPKGNYSFLPGGEAFSDGVVSTGGFEIIRVVFGEFIPWQQGFQLIHDHLVSKGRPKQALCYIELRCPKPFSGEGFANFNTQYHSLLEEWSILVDGCNPIARTNVAPVLNPPTETSLYAFAYTAPTTSSQRSSFVASGVGEIKVSDQGKQKIVRQGEISKDAIQEKVAVVMSILENRLEALEQTWSRITTANVYTIHNIHPLIEDEILSKFGRASLRGILWQYARPPLIDIEYEMDLRSHCQEYYV